MKKLVPLAATAVFALCTLSPAQAMDFSVEAGMSSESTMVYRLGLQREFNKSWWQSDTGRLTGYWDAAYTYWNGKDRSTVHSLSLSPMFVYEFNGGSVKPYIEAGIGIAGFSKSRYEGRDFGTAFNFEDRIGAGLRFAGGQQIGIRASHYSNAGIKQPNDGIESITLHYRTSF
jgi:lipid A 3-O-deacylase